MHPFSKFYIEKLMSQMWFPFYSWIGNTPVSSVIYIESQVYVGLLFEITANRSQGQQKHRRISGTL